MDNYLVAAGFVALVYAVLKFLETKLVKKAEPGGPGLVRDTLFVYVSAALGLLGMDKLSLGGPVATTAFTSKPDF